VVWLVGALLLLWLAWGPIVLLVAAALLKSGDEPAPISSTRQTPSVESPGLAPVQPDEPGITSTVTFGPGTDIRTRQHLVFTQPVTQVPILVPQRTARLSVFDDVVVDHVEVSINGKVVRDRLGEFRPGDRRAVALPAVTDTADISYVIHGGLVRTVPLSAKNGLALVNPVSVAPGSLLKITTQLTGTGIGVTNLGCMGADGRSEACGSQQKRTWTVTQAGKNRRMDVIAQLALP